MEPPARGDEGDDGPGVFEGAYLGVHATLWSEFGPIRTASGPPRRVGERGRHDAVDAPRRSTSSPCGPLKIGSGRSSCRPAPTRRPFPSISDLELWEDGPEGPGRASRRFHALANAGSTTFTKIANKWNTALIGADAASSVILNFLWERRWRPAAVARRVSVPRRPHDVFSRGGREHAGDARPAGAESVLTWTLNLRRRRRHETTVTPSTWPRERVEPRREHAARRSSAKIKSRRGSRSASTRRCRAASRPSSFIPQKS